MTNIMPFGKIARQQNGLFADTGYLYTRRLFIYIFYFVISIDAYNCLLNDEDIIDEDLTFHIKYTRF